MQVVIQQLALTSFLQTAVGDEMTEESRKGEIRLRMFIFINV